MSVDDGNIILPLRLGDGLGKLAGELSHMRNRNNLFNSDSVRFQGAFGATELAGELFAFAARLGEFRVALGDLPLEFGDDVVGRARAFAARLGDTSAELLQFGFLRAHFMQEASVLLSDPRIFTRQILV